MNSKKENNTRELIKKIVLLNAIKYNGKATPKPIFSKLLGEKPNLRDQIKDVALIINEVIKEVNGLSIDEQKLYIMKNWPEALNMEKKEETKQLPPLPNVKKYKKVVTRFSPNPDFVLHLGSARAMLLSYDYAKMYNGSFLLRFEDTDSKTKKPKLEFYDAIRNDLKWLGCEWEDEFIQSDRLEIYYEYAEKLIKGGNGYVCTCKREAFQKKSKNGKACDCRFLSSNENFNLWQSMLDGTFEEGQAVVRVKTDLDHPNPAVREWPALRIIDTKKYPHPRTGSKYRVWPLYNFSTGIDDHLMGITHIIRGKEHLTNQARQEYMFKKFGWDYPDAIHYGRLKITGASLSKSEIVKGMNNGFYKHWDDPRLATLAALRKRGITPEAIHKLITDVGPKPQDVVLSWKNLYAHNRKQIESKAKRYFFVQNPIKIIIDGIPNQFSAKLPFHPEHPEMGFRNFHIIPKKETAILIISKNDVEEFKGKKMIRFIDLFNFKVENIEKELIQAKFMGESYQEAKKQKATLIHWIPFDKGISCEVVMPDASIINGIAEDSCKWIKPNEIIQFQRFGFVRMERVEEKIKAFFAHN